MASAAAEAAVGVGAASVADAVALGSGFADAAWANIASTDDNTLLTGVAAAAAAPTGVNIVATTAAAVTDTVTRRLMGDLQFLRRRKRGARPTLANHAARCQTEVKQSRRVTGAIPTPSSCRLLIPQRPTSSRYPAADQSTDLKCEPAVPPTSPDRTPKSAPESAPGAPTAAIVRSRIAPTPSGYLHIGNAVNFLLTSWLVRGLGGRLVLRIDDMDVNRSRPEYVADIFRALEWLRIDCDEGPDGPDSFYRDFTMAGRGDYYRLGLDRLSAAGVELYACRCPRSTRASTGARGCVGGCRGLDLPLEVGRTALRMHVPGDSQVVVGDRLVDVPATMGDPVMWRRDGLAAYHLASVIEDRDLEVNVIVRGDDLRSSSALQILLAPPLGATGFAQADFRHHGLVTGPDGGKLSKSVSSASLQDFAGDAGLRTRIRDLARRLGDRVGILEPSTC